MIIALALGVAVSSAGCRQSEQSAQSAPSAQESPVQTFRGYITSEDDFADGKGQDTAKMVDMDTMARSGLGITFQSGGKWQFYYLDGNFATKNQKGSGGNWEFDGTGAQKQAWQTVEAQVKNGQGSEPVSVTVIGALTGEKKSNPGSDQDGKSFEVISVQSITVSAVTGKGNGTSSMDDGSQSSTSGAGDSMAMDPQSSSEQPMSDSTPK